MTSKEAEERAVHAEAEGYPEHAKLHRVSEESNTVGEFYDWMTGEKHISLRMAGQEWRYCRSPLHDADRPGTTPESGKTCSMCEGTGEVLKDGWITAPSLHAMLEEFFDIDPVKLEAEKQAMLEAVRAVQ